MPILGTTPDAIDRAEDRERFAQLIEKLDLKQPENGVARSREEAREVAERIGYPGDGAALLRAGRARDGDRSTTTHEPATATCARR